VPVDLAPVAAAGLIGGAFMLAVTPVIAALGVDLRMDLLLMWGTIFRLGGLAARVAGLATHAAMSVGIALVYAVGFQQLGVRDGLWFWGLLGGFVHWVLGGLFLTVVPPMHPEIPERHAEPGPFASNFGRADVSVFLTGHLGFGLAFGVGYALLHPAGGAPAAF
jgi:hypothetical protein